MFEASCLWSQQHQGTHTDLTWWRTPRGMDGILTHSKATVTRLELLLKRCWVGR